MSNMEKMMSFMNKYLAPVARAFDQNRYLDAIKNGFLAVMPFIIIGSFLLVFSNIPIDGYAEFMTGIFGEGWDRFFTIPYDATMNIMTLYAIFAIAKTLAHSYKIDETNAGMAAVVSFIILTPFVGEDPGLPTAAFGASGLFLGIITALLSVEGLNFILKRNIVIKMPPSVPKNISNSFAALIPSLFVIVLFTILRLVLEATGVGTAQDLVYKILQAPLTNVGASLPWMILMNVLANILWFFGIHGTVILGAIMDPIWLSLTADNAQQFANGLATTNIVNTEFQSNFIQLGGGGCTIGLVICMLVFAKSRQYRTLGKLSSIPGIFNINEMVIFGVPIILNPIMFIPYILITVVVLCVTYFAMASGLVPCTNGASLPWTIPVIISGFLLCGWKGVILQLVTIGISIAIWYPFFRYIDRQSYEKELTGEVEDEDDDLLLATQRIRE